MAWGVQKSGPIFASPCIKDNHILGSILGTSMYAQPCAAVESKICILMFDVCGYTCIRMWILKWTATHRHSLSS